MSRIGFTDPHFFFLLVLALPVVAALWYLALQRYQAGRRKYGEERLVDRFSARVRLVPEVLALAGWLVAVTLIVTATAGPYLPDAPQRVSAGSIQAIAVFDVGKSMAAEDYRNSLPKDWKYRFFEAHGTRLDEAKYVVASDIMPAIDNNELGLVTYEGSGFPLADLSSDFSYESYVLDNWVTLGNAPSGDDNPAAGLQVAIDEFKRYGNPGTDKVIVFFSDGDNSSDPAAMAHVEQEIVAMHIRMVVIGLGGAPVPVPVYDQNGQFSGYYTDSKGTTPLTGIEEGNLQALAAATGGQYVHLNPAHLPAINWPSKLSPTKVQVGRRLMYAYPLSLAVLVMILVSLKGAGRLRLTRVRRGRRR